MAAQIAGDRPFRDVVSFVSQQLGRTSVFAYLNTAFAPSLDESVGVLHRAYAVNNQLIVNYACAPAWG